MVSGPLNASSQGTSPFTVAGFIDALNGGAFRLWNLDSSYVVTIQLAPQPAAQLAQSWFFNLPVTPGNPGQALLSAGGDPFSPMTWGDLSSLSGQVTLGQLPTIAANTTLGNATGAPATPTAVTPIVARSVSLLNIESSTPVGDANYTILPTDRMVASTTNFTAPRTWTLPQTSSVNPGTRIIIFAWGAGGANTLTVAAQGGDQISVVPGSSNVTSIVTDTATPAWVWLEFICWPGGTWVLSNCGKFSATLPGQVPASGGGTANFLRADGAWAVPGLSSVTNSLGADVSLNNTANYFDGPSCAQGTSGTWLATGHVTLSGTAGDAISLKLWDGTTVISSASVSIPTAGAGNGIVSVSLQGVLASPAANIRISAKDGTGTSGKILFNQSGNSKDSTLVCVRIA